MCPPDITHQARCSGDHSHCPYLFSLFRSYSARSFKTRQYAGKGFHPLVHLIKIRFIGIEQAVQGILNRLVYRILIFSCPDYSLCQAVAAPFLEGIDHRCAEPVRKPNSPAGRQYRCIWRSGHRCGWQSVPVRKQLSGPKYIFTRHKTTQAFPQIGKCCGMSHHGIPGNVFSQDMVAEAGFFSAGKGVQFPGAGIPVVFQGEGSVRHCR